MAGASFNLLKPSPRACVLANGRAGRSPGGGDGHLICGGGGGGGRGRGD